MVYPMTLDDIHRAAPSVFAEQPYNVVQENLIRGGYRGVSDKGKSQRVRGIKSVDGDTKVNRALWKLTERMAELAS